MVLIQKMPVSSSSILYRWRCSRLKSTPTASGVRVRFAPSPTGKMHLGGLRTALYNFLFARSHSGSFIVRIEDTDQQRTVQGAARQIEEILDHFELYRDEGPSKGGPFGPYVQSQRLNTYVDAAERLIDAGHAYRCFCSQERLKMLRREALRKRETPRYDNLCRGLSREETAARMRGGEPSVVRFKMKQKDITFQDEVFGIISQVFDEGDFVLLKSDSYPTYHLANVVDDHAMRISHIIRGMEWISSTPKHVQLYRAFDWEQPLWLHLPLITRDGSRKLSKRDEDAFVEFYREQEGYLPLAVLNFLVRNGSGIRDFRANHLYTLEEMVENFDHTTIGRRNFMGLRETTAMAYKGARKETAKCVREVEASDQKMEDEEGGEDCVRATSNDDLGTEESAGNCRRKELIEDEVEEKVASDSDDGNSSGMKKRSRRRCKLRRKKKCIDTSVQTNTVVQSTAGLNEFTNFDEFNLDERLLKAIGELGWEKPTQIQQTMIPLALEGKNITARARTGSGKTAAFILPIIQKLLHLTNMSSSHSSPGPYALFIAPSRELSAQIFKLILQLTAAFPFLRSVNLSDFDFSAEIIWLKEHPDMIVSTPSRLVDACKRMPQLCEQLRYVVLDEADLLLSYGYENDMRQLKQFLPQNYQTIFTSATLTEDISPLKKMFLNGALVTLRLKEGQLPDSNQLTQYLITCRNEEEKFAVLLALMKLKLLVGKSVIFVSNPDRCYQLGLFLQAFQIRSCILNAQMPANSRCHVVDEFNEGHYSYIIASDVSGVLAEGDAQEGQWPLTDEYSLGITKEKKKRKRFDKESGVARGIDFTHVSSVVNFDFPTSFDCYVHRVGRTARGWDKGTAISFATPNEAASVELVRHEMVSEMGPVIMPYAIHISELESFVLRAREALAACTRSVIREARLAEIRGEALRSRKLDGYFAENPRERTLLQHDKKLYTLSLHSPAIADVPDYMVPASLRGMSFNSNAQQNGRKRRSQRQKHKGITAAQSKHRRRMEDPLRSFCA
uniref:Nondiscriminating glutamyl-tRNA synthetase EARS2, mitochondrial n=1 Tax=Parascaris univalens TaxID=6257 RepID=A0A915BG53_PARUN